MKNVRIVSGPNCGYGTKVIDQDTGKEIQNVRAITMKDWLNSPDTWINLIGDSA